MTQPNSMTGQANGELWGQRARDWAKYQEASIAPVFDAVLDQEQLPKHVQLLVLGYSQGVSVAARYVARRKLACSHLLFLSGRVPAELRAEDFAFLRANTKVHFIYGDQDQFLNKELLSSEKAHFYQLFGNEASITEFEGKHEVRKELLESLI